jgi:DNA topoisomerase-6 subunit B
VSETTFEEISAADFFYRNRDIAGFTNPSRAIFSSIRELVENSLDAADNAGIPPDIYVRLSNEDHEKFVSALDRLKLFPGRPGALGQYVGRNE